MCHCLPLASRLPSPISRGCDVVGVQVVLTSSPSFIINRDGLWQVSHQLQFLKNARRKLKNKRDKDLCYGKRRGRRNPGAMTPAPKDV